MAVLGLNDLIFLLNDDFVLHKIAYILCNMHCCLNKKIVILHLNNNIGDENNHSKSAQRT